VLHQQWSWRCLLMKGILQQDLCVFVVILHQYQWRVIVFRPFVLTGQDICALSR
jgi:hypothetical protein